MRAWPSLRPDRVAAGRTRAGRVAVTLAGTVLCALGAGLLLVRPTITRPITTETLQAVGGYQYYAPLERLAPAGFELPADANDHPRRSLLQLLEDGRPMGIAHSTHEVIRTVGGGAFSHWGDGIHFSASDNSDPRTSGKTYTVTAVAQATARTTAWAVVSLTAGIWILIGIRLDWITAAKLVALGWVLALAPAAWIPDITARLWDLQLAGRIWLLASYLLVAALSVAALAVVPFLASWPLRAAGSVVLLAGFLLDQALQTISGQHLQPDLVPVLISEREMATTVVPTYLAAVGPILAAGAALLVAFLLPARRWARSHRAAAVPVAAWLGAVGLSVAAPGHGLHVPSQVGVPAMVAVSLLPRAAAPSTRAEVAYARTFKPMIRHLVVVIDESVRGDVMGVNDRRYGNTPFLNSLQDGLINFGVATSATNCSVASRIIMRMGLTPAQLPDTGGVAHRIPTIWQYARAAGYRTSLLDAWARMHSYMDEAEFGQVGDLVFVDGEEHSRDAQLPALIANRIVADVPTFVYVNKLGIHPKYSLKVPPDVTETPFFPAPSSLDERRAADVADYHRAIRHSVDDFFRDLWPRLNEDTAVVYTSDHGQSLYEGGYDLSHCSLTPNAHRGELRVPLFVLTKNAALQQALREPAGRLRNETDHYALYSTLLQLMGYAADWADHEYGPSLWTAQPKERGFLLGTYNVPGAYWVKY